MHQLFRKKFACEIALWDEGRTLADAFMHARKPDKLLRKTEENLNYVFEKALHS